MRAIALIGARAGSKSVKDKNIRMLGGHPLLAWSVSAAMKTPAIGAVYVSTDSLAYGSIARDYGAQHILLPRDLARDDSPDLAWIEHALRNLKGELPDVIVHLRPTSPLRDFNVINSALTAFIPWHDSLRSVEKMPETAFKAFTVRDGKLGTLTGQTMDEANAPRQQFAETYRPNGYVDILKPAFIIQKKKLHGINVQAFATQPIVEVDTEEDFERLEYQLGRRHYDRPVLARVKERAAG